LRKPLLTPRSVFLWNNPIWRQQEGFNGNAFKPRCCVARWCAASPRRRLLRAQQWELFIFFARPARSVLLISGRRRTSSMISRSPIISMFSLKASRDPMLYGCTIYAVPHQRFQHSSLCISPFGFLSSGCSKLPQSMLYCRTTQAVPDIGFSLSSLRMLATLPAILRLPSTSLTADT
jgi:hypothetical protein